MGTPASSAARLRGGCVGACSASLAVAAHGAGGGGFPSGGSLVALLVVCATVGASVAACRKTGRPQLATLIAQLLLGQAVGHVILTAAAHHPHSQSPTPPMLAAHVAAAVVCALLIGFADHLYRVCVSVVSGLAAIAAPPPKGPARLLGGTAYSAALQPRYLDSGSGTRGPPCAFVTS
jgi:hypothetical protein